MNIMGIDPGLKGAFASWDGEHLLFLDVNLFTKPSKSRGNELEHRELDAAVKSRWYPGGFNSIDECWVEHVWAGKNQGVSSMFKFGLVYGIMQNMALNLVPEFHDLNLVTSQRWKKFFKLIGEDKKGGYILACKFWPEHAHEFITPRGRIKDGICDAALIALYGYEQLEG